MPSQFTGWHFYIRINYHNIVTKIPGVFKPTITYIYRTNNSINR